MKPGAQKDISTQFSRFRKRRFFTLRRRLQVAHEGETGDAGGGGEQVGKGEGHWVVDTGEQFGDWGVGAP